MKEREGCTGCGWWGETLNAQVWESLGNGCGTFPARIVQRKMQLQYKFINVI